MPLDGSAYVDQLKITLEIFDVVTIPIRNLRLILHWAARWNRMFCRCHSSRLLSEIWIEQHLVNTSTFQPNQTAIFLSARSIHLLPPVLISNTLPKPSNMSSSDENTCQLKGGHPPAGIKTPNSSLHWFVIFVYMAMFVDFDYLFGAAGHDFFIIAFQCFL